MGWSWRRSTSLGPIRLNFSQSGVGISAGVQGARVSTGPRGTYVHIGAGGFRYTKRLDDRSEVPRDIPRPTPPIPNGPRGRVVEVVAPGQIADSDPDELIEEIRRKSGCTDALTMACATGTFLVLLGLLALMGENGETAGCILMGLGMAAFLATPWASWWDRQNLIIRVHYDFDESGARALEILHQFFDGIQNTEKVWSIKIEDSHGDWKRNAGAGVSVHRNPVQAGWGVPPRVETNVQVARLVIAETTIYLFPDRLLIFGPGGIRGVLYTDITVEEDSINFIEDGWVPGDSVQVGTTWRFVNRDGGPDLRFNDNRQLPIMQYGVLNISSPSGLRLKLHLSMPVLATTTSTLFFILKHTIEDLKSRDVPLGKSPAVAEAWRDDPPPLVEPALKAVRIGAAALRYRWLAWLPE